MVVHCTNCGGAHPSWDCKRPAKKSTAPSGSRTSRSSSANERLPVDTKMQDSQAVRPSPHKGTSVGSIPTPATKSPAAYEGLVPPSIAVADTSPAGVEGDIDRQPKFKDRHKSGYMASFMRQYREKKRGMK